MFYNMFCIFAFDAFRFSRPSPLAYIAQNKEAPLHSEASPNKTIITL